MAEQRIQLAPQQAEMLQQAFARLAQAQAQAQAAELQAVQMCQMVTLGAGLQADTFRLDGHHLVFLVPDAPVQAEPDTPITSDIEALTNGSDTAD